MSNLLLFMSLVLGLGSFLVGILPLSFVFSRKHITWFSTLGTGLLIGTALGVIIPEGVEAVASSHNHAGENESIPEFPTSTVALSLLSGFMLMLVVEQFLAPHSHSSDPHGPVSLQSSNVLEFDAELGELEHDQGPGHPSSMASISGQPSGPSPSRGQALPLTLGLFVHGLADGLALGASFLPATSKQPSAPSSELPVIVFLALLIHKAPTALALTTSLLATSLPRAECRKHLLLFSSATPIGAVMSYYLIYHLGLGTGHDWTGTALLFSGGTFLFVATVLQPVSGESSHKGELSKFTRVMLIASGMFIPFTFGALLGHGHGHAS